MVENVSRKITLILSLLAVAIVSLWLMGFRLGLDLQGGTRLRYRLPFEEALADGLITQAELADKAGLTRQMIGIIRERIDPQGVREPVIRAEGEDHIVIELPGSGTDIRENVTTSLAEEVLAGTATLNIPKDDDELLDKFPGAGGIIEIGSEKIHYAKRNGSVLTGCDRGYSGTKAATHAAGDEVRLINVDPWRELIENVGDLGFYIAATASDLPSGTDLTAQRALVVDWINATPGEPLAGFNRLAPDAGGPVSRLKWFAYEDDGRPLTDRIESVIVEENDDWVFSGADLKAVTQTQDDLGFPAVGFEMNTNVREAFTDFTENHIKERMAIVINGEIATFPNIEDTLPGRGIIRGGGMGFTIDEVQNLVKILRSGSLKIKPELEQQERVGATLGSDYVKRGFYSALIGITAVLVFMLVYYRRLGMFAGLSLLASLVMLMGALAFLKATLTLPGVAGIILTVGMAVDANILIFERIREEALRGRKVIQSAKDGFANAFSTIIDANLTTLITALILYKFGTGPVKGFATTLSIGIVTSVFSALVITRVLVHLQLEKGIESWSMARWIHDTNIKFMEKAKVAMACSIGLIIAGVALFVSIEDSKKLGIDFLGGVTMTTRLESPQSVDSIRATIAGIGGLTGESAEVKPILASGSGDGYTRYRVTVKTKGDPRDLTEAERDQKDAVEGDVRGALEEFLEKGPLNVALDAGSLSGTLYFEEQHPEADIKAVLTDLGYSDLSLSLVPGSIAAYSLQATAPPTQNSQTVLGHLKDGFERRREGKNLVARVDSTGTEFVWANPIPEIAIVGAQVVTELRDKAIFAILISLFAVVMYIRMRFHEYSYGFAAVAALVHDVLFTLGVLGLAIKLDFVDAEINLPMIAAFLTIIGYSLNDTIVVFDRVRENLPRMKGSLADVIDTSINQTLSRTVLTSATTLFTVVVLLAFNFNTRSVLEGFAFALTIGVMVGTYSSMFVASPVLLWFESRRLAKAAADEKDTKTAKVEKPQPAQVT